jgi:hypothetical protein
MIIKYPVHTKSIAYDQFNERQSILKDLAGTTAHNTQATRHSVALVGFVALCTILIVL